MWTIVDDEMSYTGFIKDLRRILAYHPGRTDILSQHEDQNLSSTREHPLLGRRFRSIHIRLQVEGDKTSTTLAIQDDNLMLRGFMNGREEWYNLPDDESRRWDSTYCSGTPLGWGSTYELILQVKNAKEVMDKLNLKRLGKTFAVEAVRELSQYSGPNKSDNNKARLAVVGLMVMICDSARIKPVHDAIARDWNNTGAKLTKQLMYYAQNWLLILSALVA